MKEHSACGILDCSVAWAVRDGGRARRAHQSSSSSGPDHLEAVSMGPAQRLLLSTSPLLAAAGMHAPRKGRTSSTVNPFTFHTQRHGVHSRKGAANATGRLCVVCGCCEAPVRGGKAHGTACLRAHTLRPAQPAMPPAPVACAFRTWPMGARRHVRTGSAACMHAGIMHPCKIPMYQLERQDIALVDELLLRFLHALPGSCWCVAVCSHAANEESGLGPPVPHAAGCNCVHTRQYLTEPSCAWATSASALTKL